MKENIWFCKIGGKTGDLRHGADLPMRTAIRHAFREITGSDEEFLFSGWGGSLTEPERAVVENRKPRMPVLQSSNLRSLRDRISAIDCYTAQGARDAGLHFADISTEHVQAFRDHVLDMIDEVLQVETTPAASQDVAADTGHAEADRVIARLASSDPDFDDCTDAAVLIRKLVVELKGPSGYATWKDAAIDERLRRVAGETNGDDARRTAEYWKAEHNAANDVIAEVREILGRFDSEDVRVMARRAMERIGDLESDPESPEKAEARPRGKPCTCSNSLGSSISCPVESGAQLGELWYCRKAAESHLKTSAPPDDPHSDLPVELNP